MWPLQLSRIWCADWQAGNVEIMKSKMLFIGRGLKRDVPASFPAAGFLIVFRTLNLSSTLFLKLPVKVSKLFSKGIVVPCSNGNNTSPCMTHLHAWFVVLRSLSCFCCLFCILIDALNDWTQHSQYIHIGSPRTRFGRCICCFKLRRKVCFLLSTTTLTTTVIWVSQLRRAVSSSWTNLHFCFAVSLYLSEVLASGSSLRLPNRFANP